MKNNNKIFISNSKAEISVSLTAITMQEKNSWLEHSLNFSKECTSFIKTIEHSGPIVLSGLPIDFTIALALGSWFVGKTVVFVDPALTEKQQESIIDDLKPSCWVTNIPIKASAPSEMLYVDIDSEQGSTEFENRVSNIENANTSKPYEWRASDVAIVLFTSGSTGKAKGVCHSLQNLIFSGELFRDQFSISAADYLFNLAPLHTMSGLRCSVFLPLITFCDTQLSTVEGDLSSVLDALEEQLCTIFIAGPKLLETLAPISARIPALKSSRMMLSTGAPLPREVRVKLWQEIEVPVYDYYGLTETCGLVIAEQGDIYNPLNSSLGVACSGVKATVIFDDGREALTGTGALRIYSPGIFLGYWGRMLTKQQFFDTGDKVIIDENKEISLLGRLDRSIKSSSTLWLHPEAIESWLAKEPNVTDFAVRTQDLAIQSFIVIKKESLKYIISRLVSDLGITYSEVKWHAVNEIPRTNLSKINWNLLEKK